MNRFAVMFLTAALVGPAPAQDQSKPARQDNKVAVGTVEVLLDVVVKDKRGRAATDLAAADFEVFEDGVKQQVESFRLITRKPVGDTGNATPTSPAIKDNTPPTPSTAPAATPAKPASIANPDFGVSVVAIVFDRLSQDGRKRAHDAAMSYLDGGTGLNNFVGVFAINLSVNTVQNYTTDIGLVKRAVEKAGVLASSPFDSNIVDSGSVIAAGQREADIQSMTSAAQSGAGAGSAMAAGAAMAEQTFEAMRTRTQETFEALQRDQQGYAMTNGLMAIVNSMNRLPGRKAVLFFSEGVSIPPNVQQHFRSVINSANRANVSVYAVDSAGLRSVSPLQSTRDEINARARRRMDNLDRAMTDTSGPLTKALERNEDLLNYSPESGLSQLAQQTGGAFIGDTNNIASKLKEVDEDLGTYYLLTYSPSNQNYDGKFRNISVKVKRSGVDTLARRGYFAVPPTGSSPMFYYEAPPLALLSGSARPKDFPLMVNSLNFPESGRVGRTAVEVEVPSGAFTYTPDNEKKVYGSDFSIVVLIRDQSKQVVEKLSHHYGLVGPLKSIDSVKKGKILFYREANLPPGKYEVDAVAYDALSSKASVNRCSLEIPDAGENDLRLSSVTIIQRAEQLKEKTDSPFLVGDQLLVYPNLGEPVRKSAKQMGFYFNVYPMKGVTEAPKLMLEVLQNNKSVAKVPLKLGPPDAKGRIQYASALPLDSLNPGNYELKISVSDVKSTVSRTASFALEP
ncbi:MAG TPA: VWA domain-containing protein [Blastocatellia bacterium]|nr:VWA domain-containing protein [Blastocatellia bacterium]